MANECMNYITIKGDKESIQLFADSYLVYNEKVEDYELDFDYITPIPLDCQDDYNFRIENWGNKWDGTEAYVGAYDNEIYIDVATAWSPCTPIVDKLIRLCPGLEIDYKYYEPGMGFLGWRYHVSYEDPDEDEAGEIIVENDPYGYWTHMFIEGYESYDWLAEHIEDMGKDGDLTQDIVDELLGLIDNENNDAHIVERCLEEGVL